MSVRFLPGEAVVQLGAADLEQLAREAAAAPARRARLCLHRTHDDRVQEMVIALCAGTYVRPHRHAGKSESFHVIDGALTVLVFDDDGRVVGRVEMGPPGSGRTPICRLAAHTWHTVVVRTPTAVVHETTTGPFVRDDTEWAPWAPDGDDREGGVGYVRAIVGA